MYKQGNLCANFYIFKAIRLWIFTFFATVHNLMNYTNLIDICQTLLPVQYASNIDLIRQKW